MGFKKALTIWGLVLIFLIVPAKIIAQHAHSETYCAGGDLNCDGVKDLGDMTLLRGMYGKGIAEADLDNSGKVNGADIGKLFALIFPAKPAPSDGTNYALYGASKEKIPDFCTANYLGAGVNIITSKEDGSWTNPETWNGGVVPGTGAAANAAVQISNGHKVSFNGTPLNNIKIDCLRIGPGGELKFRPDIDTKLTVGTLVDLGYLEVGTEAAPVLAGKKAEIVIADKPIDINTTNISASKDPNQFGTGLLVLQKGKLRMHGEAKTPDPNILNPNTHAFIRLTKEPQAGDTTLQLEENVLNYKWKPGDMIVLPDSRMATDVNVARTSTTYRKTERKIIQSISSDGKIITLTTPLVSIHPAGRNADGTIKFYPHIGNLTRNIIVRSENPTGTRGHSLFSERADIDIRYAAFNNMGRTLASTHINSAVYDAAGVLTGLGTNQIGRYTIHFHHDMGPVRTTSQQTDPNVFQVTVVGLAIDDSTKWGLTIHNTHFSLFKNNVVAGAKGSGIMLEMGNEYKNVIEGNFLVDSGTFHHETGLRIDSRANIGDFGWEGSGIWSMSPFSYIHNNVAAATRDSGFAFFLQSHWDTAAAIERPNMRVPSVNYVIKQNYAADGDQIGLGSGSDIRGADIYDPNQTTLLKTAYQRMMEFKNNEAYGITENAVHLWSGGPGSTIDTFRGWNTHSTGVRLTVLDYDGRTFPGSAFALKNIVIRGDTTVFSNPAIANPPQYGWDKLDNLYTGIHLYVFQYVNNVLVENADVQGMKIGLLAPTIIGRVNDSFFKNYYNIVSYLGASRFPRYLTFTNDTFEQMPGVSVPGKPQYDFNLTPQLKQFIDVRAGTPQRWHDDTKYDIIRVYGYKTGGINQGDFRLYYPQQAANFNIKDAEAASQGLADYPSMTNQQSWSTYGNAVADAIAPCNTTAAQINGFICPLSNPATAPGVLVYENTGGNSGPIATGYRVVYIVNDKGQVKDYPTASLVTGLNFLTVTDADIPASAQLSILDLNKNGVVDQSEKFKKTFIYNKP